MRTLFLDTETTGLQPPNDKIVEVSIAAEGGEVLIDSLVNPGREIGYATTIHGITDEMVASAPSLETLWPNIRKIVTGQHVVIYNAQFDTRFFPDKLECASKISCAMLKFAPIFGEVHGRHNDHTWQKLTTAADYIGYEWEGDAHRALADALATRALWKWMSERESSHPPKSIFDKCSHCGTTNRIPATRAKSIAKCGKCGNQLSEGCPMCDGRLQKKSGKYGLFFGCSNWPVCSYTKDAPDDVGNCGGGSRFRGNAVPGRF